VDYDINPCLGLRVTVSVTLTTLLLKINSKNKIRFAIVAKVIHKN